MGQGGESEYLPQEHGRLRSYERGVYQGLS